jgi:pyruvate,orthophosphate dikinase
MEKGILPDNPFATLDRDGVGELMAIAVRKAAASIRIWNAASAASTAATPSPSGLCHELGL